jgi:hypothetical protein
MLVALEQTMNKQATLQSMGNKQGTNVSCETKRKQMQNKKGTNREQNRAPDPQPTPTSY